ncbi:unnamed protein product [Heligmosomoides polygyrus]|uniref:Uncharacterized protein n=1 Tax=Heligmosomoides polygyrus TaxID=6339 RepID=A0A183GBW9_HELPZ|nr:unnamed protein product [Heligmosomoides polygyrus]
MMWRHMWLKRESLWIPQIDLNGINTLFLSSLPVTGNQSSACGSLKPNTNNVADARVVIHLLTLKCGLPLDKEPSRENDINLTERMASIFMDFEAR